MKKNSEVKRPPEKIFLQFYEGISCIEIYEDSTWCQDKINDSDVEYVSKAYHDQVISRLPKENEIRKQLFDTFGMTNIDLMQKDWVAVRLEEVAQTIHKLITEALKDKENLNG